MSVLINTNSAATLAANNLAAANGLLQRSLNRLSSGSKIVSPADDAGGLAVSMKLSAAAKRQGAVQNNIGNGLSFLQTQDGVLKVAGKVLERIGELKTLASDPTKNPDDIATYNAEFSALQAQLTSLGSEKFNGIALFGSATLGIASSEDGGNIIEVGGADLMGGAAAPTALDFMGMADTNTLTPSGAGTLTVTAGGIYLNVDPSGSGPDQVWLDHVGDTATYDGAGGWTFSGSGITGAPAAFASGVTSVFMQGSMNSSWVGTASFTPSASGSNASTISSAANLASLDLSTVTGAIQEVATYRATNGAQQSRLQFASEVLATNKSNLEAANSRITDVDVAEESTALARYNVLVQAGTAMLAQANQSSQTALRLLS